MKGVIQGLIILLVVSASSALQALDIQAQGLFKGAAVLVINGKQQLIKVGKRSPEGVLLVSADPRQAVVEFGGRQHTLGLSRQITTHYNQVAKPEVSIRRNALNQYITNANFNGKRLSVLVDTGANAVALNSQDAYFLGIDYESGIPSTVQTASGLANAYRVKLRSVDVGGIKVSNVDGFVIEGSFPAKVLLGMSFLEHVDLREEGGILYLKGKY